ncbi:hypothetical protein GSY74_10110 [Sulfurovum sp. bin170]|uniref:hypothetical protein n=1 Tax=Sulfurovum sp. bin170 TaxID=2695268 RepID=UPI0013DF7684|nr:hypothetical protein [Sulfurovum sp. bin170]NEW61638.1 hypothetical protein [Sulfurovum sp. bin170]
MRRVINALIIVDIGIVIFCFLSGEKEWLINSQIGFITSSLVMFASIISYRNMVQSRVDAGFVVAEDNRDTIEKIEDPYDLYGEEDGRSACPHPDNGDNKKSIQELVKEEKRNLKKSRRSIWQVTKDSRAALSFYRLGAYSLLILGFFYLNRNEILDISSYLFALALPPVIVITILMREK